MADERKLDPNAPRPFDVSDPVEVRRLLHETIGYMRVSQKHGTDFEGRQFALAGLEAPHAKHVAALERAKEQTT